MRRVAFACLGIASLASVSAASAADLPVKTPVLKAPPVVAYNWTGFYIGAHVGYGWGDKDFTSAFFPVSFGSHDVSGWLAGGQLGFNWQAPGSSWVLGIEAQGGWADIKGDHFTGDAIFTTKVDWLGTVAGRLGYAWDRFMLYGKGGFAFAHDKHSVLVTDDGVIDPGASVYAAKTRTGWMAGGGGELALPGNWSVKLEYNYMDFGKKRLDFSGPFETSTIDVDQQIHVVKFGINYRFGPSPVIAKY